MHLTRPATQMLIPLVLVGALLAPLAADAQEWPSSDLLLPYFEVDLTGHRLTTNLQVTNSASRPVPAVLRVHSNWGIPLLDIHVELGAEETAAFNLRDWILFGNLPDGETLPARRRQHLQAALSGKASPVDELYYGTEVRQDVAVGYVTIRSQGAGRPDALWGNYFLIDPQEDFAQGDVLANIDPTRHCRDLCFRHSLFFVEGGTFDGGTELLVWTGLRGQPSKTPRPSGPGAMLTVRQQNPGDRSLTGEPIDPVELEEPVLAVQSLRVSELLAGSVAGTLDLATYREGTEERVESFIGVAYDAEARYSAGLQSWCAPIETIREEPDDELAVDLEKATNGHDADRPSGPTLVVGDPVDWTYLVTNTGDLPLTDLAVTDDQLGSITCPESRLDAGESMTCETHGTAEAGQYRNVGTVTGLGPSGTEVSATDPSHYRGRQEVEPAIDVEKATNGHDADEPTGPVLTAGDPVTWSYVVTNVGNVELTSVALADDDPAVTVSCPASTLASGESMTCTAEGVAEVGQYANLATATGEGAGQSVSATDPSHYLGEERSAPAIDVEKATNGHDADEPTGPVLTVGETVTWTYVVTNLGNVELTSVALTDDDPAVTVSCPASTLASGESMTCTAHGEAEVGQYANLATATGEGDGQSVSATDPSHYLGEERTGSQGCTPGYWKNHTDSWPPTGYAPSQSVESVFAQASAYPSRGSASLLEALSFNGGSTIEGAVGILLRAAVAGLLDASHPDVDYPRGPAEVIGSVDSALASGDRDTMISLAASIDADNNLGCPLN